MSHTPKAPLIPRSAAVVPERHLFRRLPMSAAFLGLLSLIVALKMGKHDVNYFFYSFHVSWLFYTSLALGAVFFVVIQFATKAGWSVVIRRLAENVALTMPLFFLLSLISVLGAPVLFHNWLSPESFADPILAHKRWYLNLHFLHLRLVIYFVIFSVAAYFYGKQSAKQDISGDPLITVRLQNASYPFLILMGFAVTFFAFDFIMTLDPHWYSTIFGVYFFASCYVAFLALLCILTAILGDIPALRDVVRTDHYHDLGKLVFAHCCFWAYAAYSQYLLIWYGNLPEETHWYGIRQQGGWTIFWYTLCIGHFLVPFLLLMARKAKRSKKRVVVVAMWVLVMHFLDLYWLIVPTGYEQGSRFSLIDVFCFIGIGGLFLAYFAAQARKKALVPIQDPRLSESLHYENV